MSIYKTPFNWDFVDNNSLSMVDSNVDESKIQEAIGEALSDLDIKIEGQDLLYKLLVNGTDSGQINIPKDQFLSNVSYNAETKKLVFVMETKNGEVTTEVDIKDLISDLEETVAEINEKNQEQDATMETFATKEEVSAEISAAFETQNTMSHNNNVGRIPTKTSELTNDSGFITNSDIKTIKIFNITITEVNDEITSNFGNIKYSDITSAFNEFDRVCLNAIYNSTVELYLNGYEKLTENDTALFAFVGVFTLSDNYNFRVYIEPGENDSITSRVVKETYLTEHQDISDKANVGDSYTKEESDGKYLTSHQSLVNYATVAFVDAQIAAIVGDAPSTLDTLKEIAEVLDGNQTTIGVISDAISTKANAAEVYNKGEIEDKIGNLGTVVEVEGQEATYWQEGDEKSIKEYVDESVREVDEKPEVIVLERKYQGLLSLLNLRDTDVNNVIVNQALADSNNVTFDDGGIDNIVVPETTKSKTITAELEPDTELTLTSRYGVTINNTSEQPTDLTVTAPAVENYSAATITLNNGEFDTITVTDASLTVQNNATVQNVVITQETTKSLTINAMFAEGATVTSTSNAAITLTSKNAAGDEVSVVLDAPGATVTMSSGKWVNVDASVSQNTLIINKNVHIENLNVTQGNVLVKVARQADIASVVEDYTLADGCSIDYIKDNVTNSNQSILNTTGEHTLTEDINHSGNFSVGTFSNDNIVWNLNNHTITVNNSRGIAGFKLRANATLEINGEGSFITPADYGIWSTASDGSMTSVVINGGNIEGATHVLYAEKGVIEVNGGTFKLTNPDACDKDANGNFKFLLNCLDANYQNGTANIIVRGGKFYGFNPAVTYGEPNGPVSYVAQGYHVVESVEDGMKVYTVVAD